MNTEIFVFGSNLAGRHGAGSALEAVKNHGAIYGLGYGLQGDSYAIPTKDANLERLSLLEIQEHVYVFLRFARHKPDWTFQLVAIGCGLAGFKPEQIAPMFKYAPLNVIKPDCFK